MIRWPSSKPVDIIGIGVAVWDTLMVVDELPREEAVLRASSRHASLGGGVAVAVAAASLCGAKTVLLDRLGQDPTSMLIDHALQTHGVDTSQIDIDPAAMASLATVLVRQSNGSRTIVFSPGDDRELTWQREFASLVTDSKVLHLNGRHLDACQHAIEVARRNGTIVSYDGGAHRFREQIVPLLSQVDVLIVAEHFACCYYQHHHDVPQESPSTSDLLANLHEQTNCRVAGITRGKGGSDFLDNNGDSWHQPAFVVNAAVDTTGCGDVFHGAFLAKLVQGADYRQCSRFASQVASINAKGLGALAIPANPLGG